MPKSRNRKGHSQKVANRNKKIQEVKNRNKKLQNEFIMNLIKKEQEAGLFDASKNLPSDDTNLALEGPSI